MNVRIVADSTADLRPGLEEKVPVVPLMIRFGEEEFVDGVTLSRSQFYEHLAVCKELPASSQPSPDTFAQVYQKAVDAGEQVVMITISSKLSGTYQSANIAAMDFEDNVFVVDSESACIGAGILVERAQQMADSGMSAAEIAAALEVEKKNLCLFATLDTLEFLKRGGRISKTVAFAGGVLNLKPVITIREGAVAMVGTARGPKKGSVVMNKEIAAAGEIDFSKPVLVGYTGNSDELLQKYLADSATVLEEMTDKNGVIISGTIGVHVGPGAYAIAYFKK